MGKVLPFVAYARTHMDTDEIEDLVRRTPGLSDRDRKIVCLHINKGMHAADIAEEDGVNYDRSTVNRHLRRIVPIVELRKQRDDERKEAGA